MISTVIIYKISVAAFGSAIVVLSIVGVASVITRATVVATITNAASTT